MFSAASKLPWPLAAAGAGCSVFGLAVVWRDSFGGKVYRSNPEISDKVYVVSGANSGIGRAVTKELASRGAKVYMACRDLRKCEEAREQIVLETRNKYVYCRQCDLASLASIRGFCDKLKENRIDGLLNNAGVMKCPQSVSEDGIEMHWATNHLGPFLLTTLLKPRLSLKTSSEEKISKGNDECGAGRVVYMVNLDYRKGSIRFDDLNSSEYDASKAFEMSQVANVILVRHWAKLWPREEITVNLVYPGVVDTEIKRHLSVDKWYGFVARLFLSLFSRSAVNGAQTPLFALVDPELKSESGKMFRDLSQLDIELNLDDEEMIAKRLLAVDNYWSRVVDDKAEALASSHEEGGHKGEAKE